jgi:hypothetical protein
MGRTVVSSNAIKTLKQAEEIAGALSRTSKMPGYSMSLPARRCQVGSVLAKLKGSVCHGCYALKGRYNFPNVQSAMERRFRGITHPRWVEAMTFMIRFRKSAHFRWHDSGDIQSLEHLERIAEIARRCPSTQFWIPTRERKYVADYLRQHGPFPANLLVRVSSALIDGPPLADFPHTSTVVTSAATCPAPQQDNSCGSCRACWDPSVANVAYAKH